MEKMELIVAFFAILGFLIFLIVTNSRIMRPNYLKPLSFFKMVNDSDLLEYTAEEGIEVTVYYAESLFANLNESET